MSAAPLSHCSPLPRRSFLKKAAAVTVVASTTPNAVSLACSANSEIRIAFIGCGGRGGELMGAFEQVPGVRVTGLCDPDPSRLGKAQQRFPEAKSYAEMRELLRDPNIDAVVVATCNHWHCLAAIWAMQHAKDVYVEKPLSHSQWEGEQAVAAARKYRRICQVGTQQRSDPMQSEIRQFLHEQKSIGDIRYVRVNRYGVRGSIGKRSEPLVIDKDLDYDAWLGPAADLPIYRNQLHYDWHWDWNTGSGEMGNWGIHVLDDVRNVAFQDAVRIPKRILVGGGRLTWNDAGQTPNVHVVASRDRAVDTSWLQRGGDWKGDAAEPRLSIKTASWYVSFVAIAELVTRQTLWKRCEARILRFCEQRSKWDMIPPVGATMPISVFDQEKRREFPKQCNSEKSFQAGRDSSRKCTSISPNTRFRWTTLIFE
ncbi:MAG: Gfo/Idh/MocA family oxidoreductase [Pirellula sp.]|nr:Gfo/Idh/MocA family oxidoreductase [Pirellula sp.]